VPGFNQSTIEVLTNTETGQRTIRVAAAAKVTGDQTQITDVTNALAHMAKVSPDEVQLNDIGPSWGSDITNKAIKAVIIFLVVVSGFIWLLFDGKMALAALIALAHDILITAGIYSLTQFQVSPDTVIAFLTILGYSLYDTIVVFDKVRENTRGLASTNRLTYSDTVNLSMNQVLARSLNTSIVAVLPIFSILVIGAGILGASALQDFGLALFVGLVCGAYSSIFIASPLVAVMKEREPRYAEIRRRLAQATSSRRVTPAAAASGNLTGSVAVPPAAAPDDTYNGANGAEGTPAEAPAEEPDGQIPLRNVPPPGSGTRPPPRPRKKGKRR
jgi:preprotein translocase subunit SecF